MTNEKTLLELFEEVENLFDSKIYIGKNFGVEFQNFFELYSDEKTFEVLYFDELSDYLKAPQDFHKKGQRFIDWDIVKHELLQMRFDLYHK